MSALGQRLNCSQLREDECGASLVEAAVILPLFLVLILGLVDVSLMLWQWNAASIAAHEGARLAVVSDPAASGNWLSPNPDWSQWKNDQNIVELGANCTTAGKCPTFKVTCTKTSCTGTSGYTVSPAKFAIITARMKQLFPTLNDANVSITYDKTTGNSNGFVGRPGPVPCDVTVHVSQNYDLIFLGSILNALNVPLAAQSTLPSEDLYSADS